MMSKSTLDFFVNELRHGMAQVILAMYKIPFELKEAWKL